MSDPPCRRTARGLVVRDMIRWCEACQGIAGRFSLPHNARVDDVAALVELRRVDDRAAKNRVERQALEAQVPELKAALAAAMLAGRSWLRGSTGLT